jgi:probable HAF family extracellular repeat protein
MTRPHVPAVVCLALCLSTTAVAQPSPRRYSVTPIPSAGFDFVHVTGMNELGHVVGIRTKYFDEYHSEDYGFFWSKESGVLDLGLNYRPMSINKHDAVVGLRQVPGVSQGTFKWSAGRGFETLPFERGVYDIDDAGRILGWVQTPGGLRGAILHPDGSTRELPAPPGTSMATAVRLTPTGGAAGSLYLSNDRPETRAVLWPAAGGYQLLPSLSEYPRIALGGEMNGQGIIAGSGMVPDNLPEHGVQRAVYWDAGGNVHNMGTLPGMITSGSAAINESGEIVGWSAGFAGSGALPWRAFVFTEAEGMLDLNDLIDDPGDRWTFTHAQDISDLGVIAVDARFNGKGAAAILEPLPIDGPNTPEPSGLLLLAGGALLLRRRR